MREETRQTSMSKASSRQGSINKLNQILSNQNEFRPASAASMNEGSNLAPSLNSVITPKGNFVVKEALPKVAPTLPVSKFEPKQIEPSIDPLRPEILAEMEAKNPPKKASYAPDWLLITLTYSFVFITILLLSNITPNGKLYIHFTAFFSMILYFITDDVEQKKMDTIVDNLV